MSDLFSLHEQMRARLDELRHEAQKERKNHGLFKKGRPPSPLGKRETDLLKSQSRQLQPKRTSTHCCRQQTKLWSNDLATVWELYKVDTTR
jgi:hypothetical protein